MYLLFSMDLVLCVFDIFMNMLLNFFFFNIFFRCRMNEDFMLLKPL